MAKSDFQVAVPTERTQRLRALLIEDDPHDIELCVGELGKAGFEIEYDAVQTLEGVAEALEKKDYDVVLADYKLPSLTGIEALPLLRHLRKDIPFILVSGTLGEETAVECLKRGATDYVLKDRLTRLPMAIRRALEEKTLRDEQLRAREALRESESGFRFLFANNPLPMWVFDRETLQFLEVNDAAIAHYGYSRDEFLQMGISDIRPPEEVARLRETVARHQRGLLSTADWRHRLKDGRLIDVEITSHALEFAGRPATLAVVQDVTERKRTEAENLRLITAIEQSAEAIMVTDQTGRIEYVNPSFTRTTGYSREEALGQNPRVLQSGKHDPAFYENLWATILAGQTWRGEIINRRKDGSLYTEETLITPVRNEKGETTHFIAVKEDISERKRGEEALRQSEERYRGLFENATYGIYRSTLEGKFLDVNPTLVETLGYDSKEELLAQDLATQIFRKAEERDRLIERYKQVGRIGDAEVEWRRKDGKAILVRLSGRRAREERSGLDCLEVIVEDITERRNLETQLRQSQKFEAVGLLAGGIAHDFNNMIGAIMGWADLGLGEAQPGDRLHGFFQKVRQQADRAAALTRQLLAFARRQILEPRNLNLNETVTEVTSLLEKVIGSDIEVQTRLAPDLEVVRVDPVQIEQVLMNLCVNARDAMPQGGCLLIETGNVQLDDAFCQRHVYAKTGRYVLLTVSDTGIGMDRATLEHIFEPFFTTKGAGKGTGLGLATLYGIVKQHNGFVHVYSEPSAGTTFRVYLPVAQGAVQSPGKKEEATRVRGGQETILLAEDHEGLREMALETLERLGYQVLVARDGEETVQLFEAHCDRIDLVLLDVVLPRLSGPDAYARISAVQPLVRALFTTGYSTESARLGKLVEAGAAILQKPYSPAILAGRVREILDRGGGG